MRILLRGDGVEEANDEGGDVTMADEEANDDKLEEVERTEVADNEHEDDDEENEVGETAGDAGKTVLAATPGRMRSTLAASET